MGQRTVRCRSRLGLALGGRRPPDELLRLYDAACTRSRAAVVEVGGDLDRRSAVTDPRAGATISLRWILLHMIEETARHNGHADLLREAIDGSVGE